MKDDMSAMLFRLGTGTFRILIPFKITVEPLTADFKQMQLVIEMTDYHFAEFAEQFTSSLCRLAHRFLSNSQ